MTRDITNDGSNPNKTALVLADRVPIVDSETNPNSLKETLISDLLKIVNVLTQDTTPDVAADFLLTYDVSAAAAKKVLPQSLFRTTTFSPSWSGITVGNGTSNGRYIQIGKLVHFDASFVLGSTSAVTGSVTLTLPVTAASYPVATQIGIARLRDTSAGLTYAGAINQSGVLSAIDSSATYAGAVTLSATIPFTWASTDELSVAGTYMAA